MIKRLLFIVLTLSCFTTSHAQDLSESLNTIKNHVSGNTVLSSTDLIAQQANIKASAASFENDTEAMALAFDVIALHDTSFGALFTSGSSTQGGISPRTRSGYELENVISTIMQAVLDHSYTEANLQTYASLFNNVKFDTSDFFPGAVSPPNNSNVSYTVQINGKHVKTAGTPYNYETEDARRPTGCYLAPGSIATITVPSSLVGIGASVLVGAHTWDHTRKPNMKRMNRVTKKYEINSQTITIANPLGGGIYINVPFENNLGTLNITLKNVVRSTYYANTTTNTTSVSEWQNTERLHTAPWADFESDKVMMQVPTSWIYALDDPTAMMNDWDMSMDAISDLMGRPQIRSKTIVYSQVDVQSRGAANFPGYPQANTSYNPFLDYGGNHEHHFVKGPRDYRNSGALTVFFHELGHAEKIYKFKGETEAFVNLLWVPVFNKKFGVDLEDAFEESSTTTISHTIDEAAISWMITENFREGNAMSSTSGQFRQEFSYQPRGYAKYADMVRLFGWDPIEDFYADLNDRYDNGTYTYTGNVNTAPTDQRILYMSKAAGYDLRPLLHFWGIHPIDATDLATSIEEIDVEKSVDIYDQLIRYKGIVPMDNNAFRAFGLNDFSESAIENYNSLYENNIDQSYYQGFLQKFWSSYSEDEGQATVDEIQNIIDTYFPDGRPTENVDEVVIQENEEGFCNVDGVIDNNNLGYTGDGFANTANELSNAVTWQITSDAGSHTFNWRHATSNSNRPATLKVNGTSMGTVTFDNTNSWTNWETTSFTVDLSSGTKTITLEALTSRGLGNIDYMAINGPNVSTADCDQTDSSVTVVHIRKHNATGFALDGGNGGANNQNLYLWSQNESNVNQQWIEIDRGDGYYTYQKMGTDFVIDGGNDGESSQNVKLWRINDDNYNQHWKKVALSDGGFQLIKRNATGFAIDGGSGGGNRQNVQLYDSSNLSRNLQWHITPIDVDVTSLIATLPEAELTNKVYPNPATRGNSVTFEYNADVDNKLVINIISISGKIVKSINVAVIQGNNKIEIGTNEFSSGMYFLQAANITELFQLHKIIIE